MQDPVSAFQTFRVLSVLPLTMMLPDDERCFDIEHDQQLHSFRD